MDVGIDGLTTQKNAPGPQVSKAIKSTLNLFQLILHFSFNFKVAGLGTFLNILWNNGSFFIQMTYNKICLHTAYCGLNAFACSFTQYAWWVHIIILCTEYALAQKGGFAYIWSCSELDLECLNFTSIKPFENSTSDELKFIQYLLANCTFIYNQIMTLITVTISFNPGPHNKIKLGKINVFGWQNNYCCYICAELWLQNCLMPTYSFAFIPDFGTSCLTMFWNLIFDIWPTYMAFNGKWNLDL